MTGTNVLFGAGVVLLAGSLAAAIAAGPAKAQTQPRPFYSYATKSWVMPGAPQAQPQAQTQAPSYAAPARALGDRVAQAAQGARQSAPAAPNTQYAASARYTPSSASPAATATPYTDAFAKAQAASKLAPTMVFFSAPVRGFGINSRFGLRKLASERRARPHEGVDFAAPTGSPVLCAAQGRVLRTGNSSTYGRYVEVEHPNGVTSFYAHLSAIHVRAGNTLSAGEALGKVGSTGRSTGPHLHFEIRRNGQQVDPQGFLGRQFAAQSSGFQVYKIAHASGGTPANKYGVAAVE